jgi:hypothetical protein
MAITVHLKIGETFNDAQTLAPKHPFGIKRPKTNRRAPSTPGAARNLSLRVVKA